MENLNLIEVLNKFNNSNRKFNVDTNGFTFVKLSGLEGENNVQLDGFFFTNGKFGQQVILINKDRKLLITLPSRQVERFKKVSECEELITYINDGKIFFDVLKIERKDRIIFDLQLSYKQ